MSPLHDYSCLVDVNYIFRFFLQFGIASHSQVVTLIKTSTVNSGEHKCASESPAASHCTTVCKFGLHGHEVEEDMSHAAQQTELQATIQPARGRRGVRRRCYSQSTETVPSLGNQEPNASCQAPMSPAFRHCPF